MRLHDPESVQERQKKFWRGLQRSFLHMKLMQTASGMTLLSGDFIFLLYETKDHNCYYQAVSLMFNKPKNNIMVKLFYGFGTTEWPH